MESASELVQISVGPPVRVPKPEQSRPRQVEIREGDGDQARDGGDAASRS